MWNDAFLIRKPAVVLVRPLTLKSYLQYWHGILLFNSLELIVLQFHITVLQVVTMWSDSACSRALHLLLSLCLYILVFCQWMLCPHPNIQTVLMLELESRIKELWCSKNSLLSTRMILSRSWCHNYVITITLYLNAFNFLFCMSVQHFP
jgi:hypothetical protein